MKATQWTAVLILVLSVILVVKNIDLTQAGSTSSDSVKTSAMNGDVEEAEEQELKEAIQALSFQVQSSFMESGSQENRIQGPDFDCEKKKTVCEAEN